MSKEKSWIQIFTEAYPKARPYIALIVVIAISTSPLIPNLYWRIVILSILASTLLLLLFDLFKEVNKRLDKIDSNLDVDEPPTFESFTNILPEIKSILFERLKENRDINIKIIAVSAQFSWRNLVEDTIPNVINIGNKSPKITIKLLIIEPALLHQWGQKKLKMDAERTLKGIPIISEKLKTEIDEGRLEFEVLLYDNIPHWHGVMIDDEILFLGRCKWNMYKKKKDLSVGQKEYRLFTKDDRFQGYQRVELFKNWFEAYTFRASILKKIKKKPAANKVQNGNTP